MNTKDFSDEEFQLVDEMASIAHEKYFQLKNHPLFIAYMEENTPIRYYGLTNIASRPTKRTNDEKLQLKDLRAIPFVSSWDQVKQNIAGYYGLGTALHEIEKNPKKWQKVRELYTTKLFFKTLLENSLMALCKTDFSLTAFLKKDATYGSFYQIILEEYELNKQLLLKITNQKQLKL